MAEICTKIVPNTGTAKLQWNLLNAYGKRARVNFKKLLKHVFDHRTKFIMKLLSLAY